MLHFGWPLNSLWMRGARQKVSTSPRQSPGVDAGLRGFGVQVGSGDTSVHVQGDRQTQIFALPESSAELQVWRQKNTDIMIFNEVRENRSCL